MFFYYFFIAYAYLAREVGVHTTAHVCVEVKGKHESSLLQCGLQGLNPSPQAQSVTYSAFNSLSHPTSILLALELTFNESGDSIWDN